MESNQKEVQKIGASVQMITAQNYSNMRSQRNEMMKKKNEQKAKEKEAKKKKKKNKDKICYYRQFKGGQSLYSFTL